MQAPSAKILATLAINGNFETFIWHTVADHACALKGRAADCLPPRGITAARPLFYAMRLGVNAFVVCLVCAILIDIVSGAQRGRACYVTLVILDMNV